MKKLFKRWLSWVLVLALSLSLMPTTLLPGASAIANMAISNFTLDAETGDWSFDISGQGTTGTMAVTLLLDARSDAALASSLPSYRATHDDISGATNGLAQKSIATEAGLPDGAYQVISKPTQSPGQVSGTSNMTAEKIKDALVASGGVFYDANGVIDLSTVTSFTVSLLVYAMSDADMTVRYLEVPITVKQPSTLKLEHALTIKTDSSGVVAVSACDPDPGMDTVAGVGGYHAKLINTGDDDIKITKLISGTTAGAWKFYVDGYSSNLAAAMGTTVSIILSAHEEKEIYLVYNTTAASIPATTVAAAGSFTVEYQLNGAGETLSLPVPWSFKRTNGISTTPVVIRTTTADIAAGTVATTAAGDAKGENKHATVTIPASIVTAGTNKYPYLTANGGSLGTFMGADGSKFNPVPYSDTTIPAAPVGTSGAQITGTGDITFTVKITAKQGNVAVGTYTANLNMVFQKSNPTGAGSVYTIPIPITLIVEEATGPRPYSVLFNSNGVTASNMPSNTSVTPSTVGGSVSMNDPGSPSAAGHTFLGWSTSPTGSVVTWPQSINSSRTYYAIWKADTYTVSYDANGHGTAPASHTNLEAGTNFTVGNGATMSEAGWTFVAWEYPVGTAQSGTTNINTLTNNSPKDITLTAKWKQNQYTVKYTDSSGIYGTTPPRADATVTYSQSIDVSGLTQAGYTFDGWYYNGTKVSNGATISSLNSSLADGGSITLDAKWKADGISLSDQTINGKEGVALTAQTFTVDGGAVTGVTYTYQVKDASGNWVNSYTVNGITVTGGASGLTVNGTPTAGSGDPSNPKEDQFEVRVTTSTGQTATATYTVKTPAPPQIIDAGITSNNAGGNLPGATLTINTITLSYSGDVASPAPGSSLGGTNFEVAEWHLGGSAGDSTNGPTRDYGALTAGTNGVTCVIPNDATPTDYIWIKLVGKAPNVSTKPYWVKQSIARAEKKVYQAIVYVDNAGNKITAPSDGASSVTVNATSGVALGSNETANLTASVNTGKTDRFIFKGWSATANGANPVTSTTSAATAMHLTVAAYSTAAGTAVFTMPSVVLSSDTTIYAVFEVRPQADLDLGIIVVNAAGTGTVTPDAGAITVSPDATDLFGGDTYSLSTSTTNAAKYTFLGWSTKSQVSDLMTSGSVNTTNVVKTGSSAFGLLTNLASPTAAGGTATFTMPDPAADKNLYAIYQAAPMSNLVLGVCIKDLGNSGTVSNTKPAEISLGGGVNNMLNDATTSVYTSTSDTSTYKFKGWATNAAGTGTLITTTAGAGLSNLNYSEVGGGGTYTMSGANGSDKTLYAVYEKVATYTLTVTKDTGIASVVVTVNGVAKNPTSGNQYTGIKATDTVVVTSTAAANYTCDGFTPASTETGITVVNTTATSHIFQLSADKTVHAKAKGAPSLKLTTTTSGQSAQVGKLNSDVAYAGHLDNVGNAVSGSVSYSLHPNADGTGSQTDFTLTLPTAAGTIAAGGSTNIQVKVANNNLTVGPHTVYLKITETGGSGYSTIVPITFTVTAEDAPTTFNGTVTVKVDGTEISGAVVKLSGVTGTQNTNASGVAAFNNLSISNSYDVEKVTISGTDYAVSNVAVNNSTPNAVVEFVTITAKLDPAAPSPAALTASGSKVTIGVDTATVAVTSANLATNTVSKIVQKNAMVNLNATLTSVTGYVFDKWTDTDGDVSISASHNLQASAAKTYVAHLKEAEQVSLIYNGNNANVDDLAAGTVIPVPPAQTAAPGPNFPVSTMKPILGGYVFKGWSETATGSVITLPKTYDLSANKTLYAIWEKAAITIDDQTVTPGVYGSGYNYTVTASRNDNVSGLKYTITGLPGGLDYDQATGRIYGIPYEVVTNKTISVTVEPANGTSNRTDAAFKATKNLSITIDKAQPTVTGIAPVGSVVSGADLNTVGWQVTVSGPRFKATSAVTGASTAADWETFTDTIIYPVGKLGPTDKTSGIGQAVLSATNSKFAASPATSTSVTADFTPLGNGTDATATTDFDTSHTSNNALNNKQSTVWKTATASKPVSHNGNAPKLEVSDDGTNFNANLSWLYATQNGKNPAHEGYTISSSGTDGYVVINTGTTADTVAPKEFTIKNSGSDTTGNLTWNWVSNGAIVDGSSYTFTPVAALPTTAIAAGSTATIQLKPPANAPAGTYTGTLTVSGGGSTATINVTFVVAAPKTFTATIKVDHQAMSQAALLENRKFTGGTGLKLVPTTGTTGTVTLADATHWLTGATEGQASGVYTVAGLEAGKTYKLVATGLVGGDYDTGMTVTSTSTDANVVYYEIATDKNPNDLTLAAQTGAGWYVKDQYATLTTPATGTKSGATYDFQNWEEGTGSSKKTYSGATTTFKVEKGNATYTAMYTERAAGTSTVTYMSNTQANGDPTMTVVTVVNGQTHTVLPGPSRDGYIFTGWNSDKGGAASGTAYAVGAVISAATVQTDPVLYAQWVPAAIQTNWGPATDTAVYGSAYRYTVPMPTTTDGKGVTLSISGLPGGLAFDAASGIISGIPYEVGTKTVTVTATHNYWDGSDSDHSHPTTGGALTKDYVLTLTVDQAQPVVTSITPVGSVISGANLNSVGWTVTVQGPRFKRATALAAGVASTTDDWETYTDTITYNAGYTGAADKAGGIGQAAMSSTSNKFAAGTTTSVTADFTPLGNGTDATASTDFDTAHTSNNALNNKQSTVWKIATATLSIPHSGNAPILEVSDDGTNFNANLSWLYAVNNAAKDPAHEGYGAGSGTDGYVVLGTPDTVAPKKITLKNNGTAETGALTYTWVSNGATVGGTAYTFTDNIDAAAKATIGAGATREIIITPPAGAPAGTYTGTLKITGAKGGITLVNVTFVVVDPEGYTVKINTDHYELDNSHALKNLTQGDVVLTELDENGDPTSTTITITTASTTGGVYTGTAVFGKKYAVTVNGYRVPNLTITTQNPEATVDLAQVTIADDPAAGVTAASTLSKGYVVKGESVTVTTGTANTADKYGFKELQDVTGGSAVTKTTTAGAYTQVITDPTAFKAVWVQADAEYTLKFDGNGSTDVANFPGPDDMTVTATNNTVTLPGQFKLKKDGFVFKGWGTTTTTKVGDAGFYYAGASYTVTGDTTLYAVWEPAASGLFLQNKTITAYYGEPLDGQNQSMELSGTPVGTPSYTIVSTLDGDGKPYPLNNAYWNAVLGVGSSDAKITGTPKLSGVDASTAATGQTYQSGPFDIQVKATDGGTNQDTNTATLTIIVEKAKTKVDPTDGPELAAGVTLKPGDTFDPATQLDPGKVDAIKHNGTDKLQPNVPGTWSLADGETGEIGAGPKQNIRLKFTPFDEGFEPVETTIEVDVAAKKIKETVLNVSFPANSPNNEPDYVSTVESATEKESSIATATKNDVSIVKDKDSHDVSWTSGVNAGGKFEATDDKVLYMVIRPNTTDNWVFVTAAAGDGPVKVILKDKQTGATVEATVISCTETEATITYKWAKEDVKATAIKDQVVKPVDKANPNFTAVPIGDPAGSHTASNVTWVKDTLSNVTSANYAGKTPMGATDTYTGGEKYVAIITATAASGYYFDDASLAALDGSNAYAQIRGDLENFTNAKVLKKTVVDGKVTEVVIAAEFEAVESTVVGLNSATGPLVYYAKTNTHTATNQTGHNAAYDFTLDKSQFTVNSVNSLGAVAATTDFALFVDNGTTPGEYDSGDTILVDTSAGKDKYTFENVYGATADLTKGTGLDGKQLWAVRLDATGKPSAGAQNATRVGTLTVKELQANRITQVGGTVTLTYTSANKNFAVPTAPTADVDFNLGMPMENTVAGMTYAVYSAASAGSKTYFYEMADAGQPTFVAHDAASGAVAATALLTELTVGAEVTSGKTLYMTYIDQNNNVVRTPVGVFRISSSLEADYTDENGYDPEYGDKLTAQPIGGTPKPDGTYDYVWEKWNPTGGDGSGAWEPIPGATGKDYIPGKDDVGEKIHVTITDGEGNSDTTDDILVQPRSLNFIVEPQNKNEDKNDNSTHTYVAGLPADNGDFTPTAVLKHYENNAFKPTASYGGVKDGDTVVIGPSAAANAAGGWNETAASSPKYTTDGAKVGSEIVWPQVLEGAAADADKLGGYTVTGPTNAKGAAVYRLRPQDSQDHRGIIMGGGGDIIHVDVSFEEVPVTYHDVPGEPMGVTDDRETRPGEDTGSTVNTAQNYVASWYTAANASAFNNFDPTNPAGTAVTTPDFFLPNQAYTVLVKVKPQPGKFYNLGANRDTNTKFYFHFGTNKSVEVVQDATGLTPSGKITEIKTGLKEQGGVYYMWYTFETPNGWVLPVQDPVWPEAAFNDQLYYAKTGTADKHYQTNAAGSDNAPTPGGKGGVDFTFKTASDIVNVIKTNGGFTVKTDDNTTITLSDANYGSFWRLVSGNDAATAQDQFLDNLTGWTANATPGGKTFQDAHTVLADRTLTADDSLKFADAKIYVQLNNLSKTVVNDALTDLKVRQLTAEDIAPSYVAPATAVKLNYKESDAANGNFDSSAISGAVVDFNKDAMNVSYTGAAKANTVDSPVTGTKYYFQYLTESGYQPIKDGDAMTRAGHDNRLLYICYTDVNGHVVRKLLGKLSVTDADAPEVSTAAIYIKNNTNAITDTQYGDELEAVVVGSTYASTTWRYKWQRDTGSGWTDIAGATDKTYRASKEDVLGKVRVILTQDGTITTNTEAESVDVGKKKITADWTWVPGVKNWDNSDAAPVTTTTAGDNFTYVLRSTTSTEPALTHGNSETVNDVYPLNPVSAATFDNANPGKNKPITITTGGDIPTTGGTANGAANTADWNQWYTLEHSKALGEIYKLEIRQVNVNLTQPAKDGDIPTTEAATADITSTFGTDGSVLDNVTVENVSWTDGAGNAVTGKFAAGGSYKVTFDLKVPQENGANKHNYEDPANNMGVRFNVNGINVLGGQSSNAGTSAIKSVATAVTNGSDKETSYTVTVEFEDVPLGEQQLPVIVVDASNSSTKAGDKLTGPVISNPNDKPYELVTSKDNKWQYYDKDNSRWEDINDLNTYTVKEGTEYRVITHVQLKDSEKGKYFIDTKTGFYLSGSERKETENVGGNSGTEKQLSRPNGETPDAAGIYSDDTVYKMVYYFKTDDPIPVENAKVNAVTAFFKKTPAANDPIPAKPQHVVDSVKETQPGETGAADFTATWYKNTDNTNPWAPTTPTANGWAAATGNFEPGKFYTVAVKVKPKDGYSYTAATKYYFHFGEQDSIEVTNTGVYENGGVYTMYYTFQVPAGEIDAITAVDGTFDDPHYAATVGHKVGTAGTGEVANPDFTLNYTINSITVHYEGDAANTTITDPAEIAALGIKAHVNNVDLDDGYIFTQATNDGSTKTTTGRFDGKQVFVSIGNVVSTGAVTLKDANDPTKDTLVVKELEVDNIVPVYKAGETAVKLDYANGDAFDPSNITDAKVDFLTGVTGLENKDVVIADEMTSASGTDQNKYYYELDNGTRIKTGDTMSYGTMNGRILFICYTDVNGHKVRAPLGTLKVPAPEDPTIIKVAANVKQPIAGQAIDTNASVLLAVSADNRDVTDKVTTDTVKWINVSTGTPAPMSAGDKFQTGGSYQAEFNVKVKGAPNKFIADAVTPDYLDLLINGVTHTGGAWLEGLTDNETVGADGSINQIKVEVEPTSTGSEETSYRVTVTFNNISDKTNILSVLGLVTQPKAGDTIAPANIKVNSSEPYEIVPNTNKWYEDDGITEITDAAAKFKPGQNYYAELTVKIKDTEKPYYKFLENTSGTINGDTATVVTKNPTTGEPDTITLKLKFTVPEEPINVVVKSTMPTKGVTAGAMNATIGDYYNGSGHYTVDGNYYWADASGNKMDPGDEFEAGKEYRLVFEKITPETGYKLGTAKGSYTWFEGAKTAAVDAVPNGNGYTVYFTHRLQPDGVQPLEPMVNVDQPVKGQTPDQAAESLNKSVNVIGDVTWTGTLEGGKFKAGETYTAEVEIDPARPDGFGNYSVGDTIKFNGDDVTVYEKDGKLYVKHSWTLPSDPPPQIISGGGGGGGTTELPQVFYKLGEVGVTNDLTAEKVKMNGKPSKVPKVEGLTIEDEGTKKTYTFVGWSETDPAKTTGTPVLVDPTTFKITKDKTFYAVYEIQGHTAIDHTHYVIGFPDGTFGPSADITRAEVATIIARACLDGFIEGANYGNPGGYSDVERHWAYSAISYCTVNSVFTGYTDGTFRPNQPITRQELATVVARLHGLIANQGVPFTDAGDISKWAVDGVYTAYAKGWIHGYKDGSFKPLQNITRAETVKVFNGYLSRGVDVKGLEEMKEYVHSGVASNNRENGFDEYMTWPDVPKNHWAYYEIIEAANDHTFYWLDETNPVPPEHWSSVWIDEIWRYHDSSSDGARPSNPETSTPGY